MSGPRMMTTAGGLVIALASVHLAPLHAQGQISELSQDSKIIFQMAASNLLEIRLGQLAQQKSTNAAVKQFGQQMVTDHTNMQNQLTASVSKGGTKFQPGMGKANEAELARLEKLSGAEFDRAYMSSMIQHHQQDVALLQGAGQSARSAEARQLVTSGLPALQQHLNMATQVGSQVGAGGGVAAVTQPVQNPPTTTTTQNPTQPVTQPGQVTSQTQADITADMPFVRDAASSNLMEIRLGQLAQSKASNQAVKQFGQRMVTDHTNLQNQLTAAASGSGQTFTATLDSRHERQVTRLERLSGAEFDRAYMSFMIRGHQEEVSNFQTQSQSARSAQIRTLAANSLPVLQQHVSLAVQVGSQVGADSTTNFAGGNDDNGGGDRGKVRADAEFIRDVGADNTMQIQLAELAREKARNREVRQFAERLISDHTRLQNQWNAMASRNGMAAKPGMGPRHREKIEQLQKVNGRNFDRAYMVLMIQQHQDEVSYWQKEGRASRSPEVRRLVNNGLPTLEQHLAQAKQVGRQVGVNPDEALRNRKDIARDRDDNKKEKDKDKD